MASIKTPINQDMLHSSYWTPATIIFGALQVCVMCSLLLFSLSNTFPVWIVLALVIYMISTFLFIWWAKKKLITLHERQIFYFLIFYLFSIYSLKVPYCLFLPDLFWPSVSGGVLRTKWLIPTMGHSYFIFLVGYISFFIGYLILGKGSTLRIKPTNNTKLSSVSDMKKYHRLCTTILITVCSLGLIIKAFSLYFLQIGVPSVVPQKFLFPGLVGVIFFFCMPGLQFLLTVLLLLTAIRRHFFLFGFALALLGIFAILDLSVGWKKPILYSPLIIGMVAYACYRRHIKSIYRFLTIGVLALSLIGVQAYVGIQYYRYSRLSGKADISSLPEAIFSASSSITKGVTSIYTRLGGLDQLMITVTYIKKHPEFEPLGIASFWEIEVTDFFTHKIIGVSEESITSCGSNQWGQFLLSVGFWGLIGGMFVLGIIMKFIQRIFLNRCKSSLLGDAIVPAIFILFVKVFASAGEFIYLAKYTLILWICFWFTRRILGDKNIYLSFRKIVGQKNKGME